MAARRNNNNQKNQKAETETIPESAEDPKSKDGQLLERQKY